MTKSEQIVKQQLHKEGWSDILRRGWPDFLCLNEQSGVAVEVKREGEKITEYQRKMHEALRRLGIEVRIRYASRLRLRLSPDAMKRVDALATFHSLSHDEMIQQLVINELDRKLKKRHERDALIAKYSKKKPTL